MQAARMAFTLRPIARAASGVSPTARTNNPQRVLRKNHSIALRSGSLPKRSSTFPLFPESHSPRLTSRRGLPPRRAPATIATGTPSHPAASLGLAMTFSLRRSAATDKESAVGALQAFAEKDCQEDESLEDQDGRVWELVVSLQHAAALDQSSEQQ